MSDLVMNMAEMALTHMLKDPQMDVKTRVYYTALRRHARQHPQLSLEEVCVSVLEYQSDTDQAAEVFHASFEVYFDSHPHERVEPEVRTVNGHPEHHYPFQVGQRVFRWMIEQGLIAPGGVARARTLLTARDQEEHEELLTFFDELDAL